MQIWGKVGKRRVRKASQRAPGLRWPHSLKGGLSYEDIWFHREILDEQSHQENNRSKLTEEGLFTQMDCRIAVLL